MNKNMLFIGVMVLVVGGGIFLVNKDSKVLKETNVTSPQEQTEKTTTKKTGAECTAGTTKTVVGRTYTTTGTETHTIQGKSFDLCCWEIGEADKKKKICADSVTSPVGYDNGVLFENNKNTGGLYKSMETYRDGGKVCQQFYNNDGTAETLNCQDRLN